MKPLKQSETVEIRRSALQFNANNPKRHTEQRTRQQKKNLETVGYLGGVVWNEQTGAIIDGHRRIMAMDQHYRYDPSDPSTDYVVKVEKISLDPKAEKEQMTYMALANTKADYSLIAEYMPEIDPDLAGVDDYDYREIMRFAASAAETAPLPVETISLMQDEPVRQSVEEMSPEDRADYEARKQHMIDVKRGNNDNVEQYGNFDEAYITVSFSTFETKQAFCDMFGVDPDARLVKGEQLLQKMD